MDEQKKQHVKAEENTKNLFNKLGCSFQMSTYEKEHYDIFGKDRAGRDTIVEVKERFDNYDEWILEVYKADKMLEYAKDSTSEVNLLYVCIHKGKYYVYSVDKILKQNKRDWLDMPRATDTSFYGAGGKVKKECYFFNKDSYVAELVEELKNKEKNETT